MKINFDGSAKELTGNFPRRFKLLSNGTNVPFVRLGNNKIRLTQDIPAGVLDVQEVSVAKRAKPASLSSDKIAIINKADFDQIDILSKKLGLNQELMNKQIQELTIAENNLANLETQNADDIAKTNDSIRAMAEVVGSEILNVRESNKKNSSALNSKIDDTASMLFQSIDAHSKANNPHKITKSTIGLSNVDNTSDIDKPISKATKDALDKKADKSDINELSKKIDATGKQQDKIAKGLDRINILGGVGGKELPSGGLSGQVLTKGSDKDGDISWKSITGVKFVVVDELPEVGEDGTIYFVSDGDKYVEWVYVKVGSEYKWEKLGYDIDISGKQDKIDEQHKLSASLILTDSTHRFATDSEKTTWNNKLSSITSTMVTNALGYTPYNSSNPNGYITSSYHDSSKQNKLTAGTNIEITNDVISVTGDLGAEIIWRKY